MGSPLTSASKEKESPTEQMAKLTQKKVTHVTHGVLIPNHNTTIGEEHFTHKWDNVGYKKQSARL
jgi:hypothetical protein